jgi:hypothetical protein
MTEPLAGAGAPQAFFTQEWAQLEDALAQARHSVAVRCKNTVVRPLFDALVQCRRQGLAVHLALPDTGASRHSAIAWERLSAIGGLIAWLPASASQLAYPPLVLVVDGAQVWTGKLSQGMSPLDDAAEVPGLVRWDDPAFAQQTRQVLDHEAGWMPAPDTVLTERLAQATSTALELRRDGAAAHQAWLAAVLHNHALATQAEIAETQRQMALFDHAQEQALGALMRDYLRGKAQYLQQLALQDRAAQDEAHAAQQRWDDYASAQAAQDTDTQPLPLDADALDQLKQMYRKLAMQCHPDRVADADQGRAAQLFQSLQSSYRRGDMAALYALQESVAQAGLQFVAPAPQAQPEAAQAQQQEHGEAEQAAVQARVRALRAALAQRHDALEALRSSPTWRTLSSQPNWDLWFAQQQQHLQSELDRFALAVPIGAQPQAAAVAP